MVVVFVVVVVAATRMCHKLFTVH